MSLFTGTISIQCHRDQMEDRFFLDHNFNQQRWIFGGVYDGHTGHEIAEFTSQNLHRHFQASLANSSPSEAFIVAYNAVSAEVVNMSGGTCAANFLLQGFNLHYANVGDCRIIVVGQDIKQLTIDHTVEIESERIRIIKSGGLIKGKYVFTDYRGLAVTRSLGDVIHKKIGVIATPDVGTYHFKPTDRYVIAGSDGLFGKVSNEEIAKAVNGKNINVQEIAEELKNMALEAGSTDNMTIIVLSLID